MIPGQPILAGTLVRLLGGTQIAEKTGLARRTGNPKMAPGSSAGAIAGAPKGLRKNLGVTSRLVMIRVRIAPFPARKGSSLNAPLNSFGWKAIA